MILNSFINFWIKCPAFERLLFILVRAFQNKASDGDEYALFRLVHIRMPMLKKLFLPGNQIASVEFLPELYTHSLEKLWICMKKMIKHLTESRISAV